MADITKNYYLLILFITSLFLLIVNSSSKQFEVLINEISTNNNLIDSYGNYSDWIELYNSGNKEVNLTGYGLSNEFFIPFKWRFPKNCTIGPGQYLIVFASEQKSNNKELHTNFKLYKKGDTLFFSDLNFSLIEKVDIPLLE
jgi:hypothetical protein